MAGWEHLKTKRAKAAAAASNSTASIPLATRSYGPPSLDFERASGFPFSQVAGVDEVGRGCLAGPVVSAAALLPLEWARVPFETLLVTFPVLAEVRDSKLLNAEKRLRIRNWLVENLAAFCVGEATREEIDEVNILNATHLSMIRALGGLKLKLHSECCNSVLIDGNRAPKELFQTYKVTTIIKGDQLSLSIACASIIAKVHRDEHLVFLSKTYPNHRFEDHKGYGTKAHLAAIENHGVTPEHRRSFAPVREYLQRQNRN